MDSYMPAYSKGNDAYLSQKVMTASPEQLISYLLDAGIVACARGDRAKASRVIQELIDALDFDHDREIATSFFKLYQYLLHTIHKGRFEEAQSFLSEFKKTWSQAMKVV